MKVLVAGSVPPPANGHRAALLEEVVRLRREGHHVEVLSLDRHAAAHRYLSAPGLPAVLAVASAGRRFDAVVVQIEPGLPVRAGAGRAERAVTLLTFALLLRRLPEVTLRWDHPDDFPGGPGGRPGLELWRRARRVVLGPQVDAEEITGLLGDRRERLSVGRPGSVPPIGEPQVDWGDTSAISAAQVNEVVRRRAAASRQILGTGGAARRRQIDVRVEQWEWLPSPGLGVPNLGPLGNSAPRRRGNAASLRGGAARALAVAERHGATRPIGDLARFVLSRVRAARRGG